MSEGEVRSNVSVNLVIRYYLTWFQLPINSLRGETIRIDELLADKSIIWHQKYELGESGIFTPGLNEIERLFELALDPSDLKGANVLDIGTTNGGAAFLAERYGANKVIAVDICGPEVFGFDKIRAHLGSNVIFLQSSVYELPEKLDFQKFDLVFFWGVLYHLRHPLLALDIINQISKGLITIESAISSETESFACFFRHGQLFGDESNWWAPTEQCLLDMVESAGFSAETKSRWGRAGAERILINGRINNSDPEYLSLSYEREISGVTFSTKPTHRIA